MFKALFISAGLAGLGRAAEVHEGITFDIRFGLDAPLETQPVKTPYKVAAAKQTTKRLIDALKQHQLALNCLEGVHNDSPEVLYQLKHCIIDKIGGSERIFLDLLENDIKEANHFWDKIINESTDDRSRWVGGKFAVRAYFNGALTATQFGIWSATPEADAVNNWFNPEHYYKATVINSTTLSGFSAILEGWGGVESSRFGMQRTNFTVPVYAAPERGSAAQPASWSPGDNFPPALSRIGDKVLVGGSKWSFGVLNINMRDFKEGEEGNDSGKDGIEIYAAIWYPPWDKAADETGRKEFPTRIQSAKRFYVITQPSPRF